MFLRSSFGWLAFASCAFAADLHLTPDGAGRKDGADWSNAFDQPALHSVVNERMKPGDRLLLGGGAYAPGTLKIASGGSAGKAKVIEGVDRGAGLPVLGLNWRVDTPANGGAAIQIAPGVSHVTLRHLRIKGGQFAVHAPPVTEPAARTHLVFENVDAEQIRYGFYLADCDDLRLIDCDLRRYTKHGFRFDRGCDRVLVQKCVADCSEADAEWETKTELLPFGFSLNDGGAPNTAFVFEDCLATNHMMPLQKGRYKNGDGFVVEGNSSNVAFRRCRSLRNQDGGYDLKVADVTLLDCVAIGNKRDYRIWTTGILTNCLSGWSGTGLWTNGGPVTAVRCTFHEIAGPAAMTDDNATQHVTLKDCLLSACKAPQAGKVVREGSLVTTAADAGYLRPDPSWDGLGDAMNNRAHPDKGYRAVP